MLYKVRINACIQRLHVSLGNHRKQWIIPLYAAEPGRNVGFAQVAKLIVTRATRPSKTGEILALESYFTANVLNKKQQTIHTPGVKETTCPHCGMVYKPTFVRSSK